jgi:hypothetical protein
MVHNLWRKGSITQGFYFLFWENNTFLVILRIAVAYLVELWSNYCLYLKIKYNLNTWACVPICVNLTVPWSAQYFVKHYSEFVCEDVSQWN